LVENFLSMCFTVKENSDSNFRASSTVFERETSPPAPRYTVQKKQRQSKETCK
jgi:hypothetical protein